MADSQSSLLEQARSGNRQLQLLAADGLLPLAPEQIIPLQVDLALGTDQEVAERARESLRKIDPRIAGPFLELQANERALTFFADEVGQQDSERAHRSTPSTRRSMGAGTLPSWRSA